jgi:hypothetical protein
LGCTKLTQNQSPVKSNHFSDMAVDQIKQNYMSNTPISLPIQNVLACLAMHFDVRMVYLLPC